ncbi:MAG: PQQ-binding-like beta-propeller repeat protein [Ignavibacteriae bacterium]|nr:PQQ-binding-like beta-propeller repeat protein [Ignavibacteriota bacterium]
MVTQIDKMKILSRTRARLHPRWIVSSKKIRLIFLLFIFYFLLFQGCNYLRLPETQKVSERNWAQYGGVKERTNVSSFSLTPPLEVAWMYDAAAGFSEYPVSVADSFVFLGTLQGELHVIHLRTGKSVGSVDFDKALIGTPVVDGEMVYIAIANTEESLQAYDLVKGKVVWKAKLGGIETSPLLINNKLYVTTLNGYTYCIEKNSGAVVWKFLLPLFERSAFIHSSPASDGNVLVFGCDDGSVFCLSLEDGKLLWRTETGKSIFASPSVSDGKVFFGSQDEFFYALNINDGTVAWKQHLGAKIFSSQAVDETRMYVGTSGGEIFCLEKTSGKIVWKERVQSAISCAPLVSGKVVYVGSLDKNLYAFDATNGTRLWNYVAEGRIKSMPVIFGDYLILPLDNRMVVGLKSEER